MTTTKEPAQKPAEKIKFATGKRKKAVAKARLKEGTGRFSINSIPFSNFQNRMNRLVIEEPLILVGDAWKTFDIDVTVSGGGPVGQAQAIRQAIARCLSQALGAEIKKTFLNYDRKMLTYDPRRTEPHKPSRSSQGPRKHKQRSKR
jgi:small subunit ribosomal protein S9